nr:hypothetical protein ICEMyc226_00191 [Mycolicibacterium sp.]
MASPKVWVSTTAREAALGGDGPGVHWQHVGSINTTQEKELWSLVQVHLGLKAGAPLPKGFYLDGLSSSPWIAEAKERGSACESFWLAIDPFGDASRYFVTVNRSTVGSLARRAPETHPGLVSRPISVGIRLSSKDSRLFDSFGPAGQ